MTAGKEIRRQDPEHLFGLVSDFFWEEDAAGRFTRLQGACVGTQRAISAPWRGRTPRQVGFDGDAELAWPSCELAPGPAGVFRDRVVTYRLADGTRCYFSLSGEALFDRDGRRAGSRGFGKDVTAEQAQHEELTRFRAAMDVSQDMIFIVDRATMRFVYVNQTACALAGYDFIDLDRFKSINDSLGHAAGDTLLKTIATRLKGCLRRSDTVARIGGDEFLLLVRRIDSGEAAARLARQLLSAMLEPVQLIGHTHRVTASIGIACCPDDAQDAADLIKKADMAMYRAKEEGKNNFQFYRPEMQTRSLERVRLEIHLRLALERAEFTLAYQARINLRTNEITGVEALLRWHSAELGDLTPNQFLPVAEETGLILPIGRWVLETACVRNVGWQQAGLAPLPVAVNLSPMQFADPQLIDHLSHALEVSGMVPELLELEISESAVTRDIGRTLDLLRRIKSLGVRIAIDNFGTSYSSLTQLRQLPVDSLKIDRSFVRELCHNAADQATARAIIGMARNLSLNVVAEGVETAEQQSYLRSEACDDIQGFYFSRPSDAVAFEQLLRSHVPGA